MSLSDVSDTALACPDCGKVFDRGNITSSFNSVRMHAIKSHGRQLQPSEFGLGEEEKAPSPPQKARGERALGSEGHTDFLRLGSYFELLGVLVNYGTINEDLVLDLWYLLWDKLGPIVKGYQKAMETPRWLEHYESLAQRKVEWLKEHPPVFQR